MSATASQIKMGSSGGSKKALIVSIILGLVAATANVFFVARVQGGRVQILKAKSRLPAGTKITRNMFETVSVYGDLKQMKALMVENSTFDGFAQIPLSESIEPGQILLQSSFAFSGNRGLLDEIGPNERAIALDIQDDTRNVARFVKPRAIVDVWANDGSGWAKIIPNAVVRAVDDATIVPSDHAGRELPYRTVTVIVPESEVRTILTRLEPSRRNVTLVLAGEHP